MDIRPGVGDVVFDDGRGVLFFILTSEQGKEKVRFAAGFFCVHLMLNTLWSILFFGMRDPFLAFIDIIVLWLMITALVFYFLEDQQASRSAYDPLLALGLFCQCAELFDLETELNL